jgi:transcriptional regulator with XRE-family HTH domain
MALSAKAEAVVARAGVPELVRLRLEAGLTVRAASEALGALGFATHHGTISDWESGEYIPADRRLRAYARVLRVSAARLEAIFLDARAALAKRAAS